MLLPKIASFIIIDFIYCITEAYTSSTYTEPIDINFHTASFHIM